MWGASQLTPVQVGLGIVESGYLLPSAESVGSSDYRDDPRREHESKGGFKS